MMKRICLFLLPCLCILLLLLPCYGAADVGTGTETLAPQAVTKLYTVTDEKPEIIAENTFFAGMAEEDPETDVNFQIEGENLSFYFTYDNLYRNTGKYETFRATFSAASPTARPDCPAVLASDMKETDGVLLDFPDGEHYPGIAEMTVSLGEAFAGRRVCVYEWVAGDGVPAKLGPLANGILLDAEGALQLTVTESRDYLVLDAAFASAHAAQLHSLEPVIILSHNEPLPVYAIVLIIVGGVLLLAALLLIAVLLLRRHNAKGLQPTAEVPRLAKAQPASRKNEARRKKNREGGR